MSDYRPRRVSTLPGDVPQDGAEGQGSNVTGGDLLPRRVRLQEITQRGESNRDDKDSRVVAAEDSGSENDALINDADDDGSDDDAPAYVDATGQGGLLVEQHEPEDDTPTHVDAAVDADEELHDPEDDTHGRVDAAVDADEEFEDTPDDERGADDPNEWEEDLDEEDGGDISEGGGGHELNGEDTSSAAMRRGRKIERVVARRRAKNKISGAAFRMICGKVRAKVRHIYFANGVSSFESIEGVNGTLFYVLSCLGYIGQVPLDDADCRTESQLKNRRTSLRIVTETVAQTGRDFRHEVLNSHSAA